MRMNDHSVRVIYSNVPINPILDYEKPKSFEFDLLAAQKNLSPFKAKSNFKIRKKTRAYNYIKVIVNGILNQKIKIKAGFIRK